MRRGLIVFAATLLVLAPGCDEDSADAEPEAEQPGLQADEESDDQWPPENAQTDQAGEQQADDAAEQHQDQQELAGVDPDYDYPDFDMGGLSERQRLEVAEMAFVELCPCEGSEESLHACMQREDRCEEADEETAALLEVVAESDGETDPFERRAEQRAQAAGEHQFDLEGLPMKGDPSAPVQIVEFANFQCPHCRTAAQGLEEVYERFGDDVAIYFMNLPGRAPVAQQAARASLAAQQQGRFWEMHELLFEHQREVDRSRIEQFARRLGLNMERFRQDMESDEIAARLASDRQQGAEAGVTGTPAIFINGERYTGNFSGAALGAKVSSVLDEQG